MNKKRYLRHGLFKVMNAVWLGIAGAVSGSAAIAYNVFRESSKNAILQKREEWGRKDAEVQIPSRDEMIKKLRSSKEEYDILVIGGGAVGTSVAMDATLRGAKVALVDYGDFGDGTSSRSTKIIHGGIRYLEKAFKQFNFDQLKLVFNALGERKIFLNNAPHLTETFQFMIPCYHWWELPYFYAGIKIYDLMALNNGIGSAKLCLKSSTLEKYPQLKEDSLKGSIIYYDGKMDDARMVTSLAMTAAAEGATVANYVQVTDLIKEKKSGQIVGAKCYDRTKNLVFDLYAKVVVNATGAFSDELRVLSTGKSDFAPIITPSSGTHIVLPQNYGSPNMALVIPRTDDNRNAFIVPWMKKAIVGTTDKVEQVTHNPQPTDAEIQWFIDTISQYLKVVPTRDEILASWKGFRPLVSVSKNSNTSENMTRDHYFEIDPNGLVTAAGGKWTSYRSMSESLVDLVDRNSGLGLGPCQTKNRAVIGGNNWCYNSTQKQLTEDFSRAVQIDGKEHRIGLFDDQVVEHLARNYGSRAPIVAKIAKDEGYADRLVPDYPFIEAEVVNSVKNEWAQGVDDFIFRRIRLGFIDEKSAKIAVPRTAEIMGKILGWSRERIEHEIHYAYNLLEHGGADYTHGN